MRILIAIDGSHYSQAALQQVLDRPWPAESEVKVISVVEPFHPEYAGWHPNYVPVAMQAQKDLLDAARSLVDEAIVKLNEKFSAEKVTSDVLEGYIKDQILDTARDWHADLIVVGSHGRRGLSKFLLGSVSEAILANAPCSVEIVKVPHEHHVEDKVS